MTEPGTLLAGRYRLLDRLARGGMGAVWRARDETLQRDVAVKVLHAQAVPGGTDAELAAERALREARITARLHHPNAVPVFDVVEHDGRPCLVMQYLPSRSLQAVLDEARTLPADRVARLGAEVAGALAAAHRLGIIHRDVKPANVLVTDDGTAKLTDFGISHSLGDASLTSVGFVTGTPAYLAPEIARGGSAGFASDVHSLGATLYRAVEGAPPYGSDSNAMVVMHRVATGRFTPPTPGAPLSPLLARMLAADPANRPPMHNIALALRDLATGGAPGTSSGRVRVVSAGPPRPAPTTVGATPPPVRHQPPRPGPPPQQDPRPPQGPRPQQGPRPPQGPPSRAVPVGPPAPAGPPARRRRGAWIAAVVVGLLLVGGIVAYALSRSGGTPQAGGSTPAASGTPAPPASDPTSAATAPTDASTPTDSPTAANTGTPTAAELAAAISSYYTLVPSDTDAGWQLLTADYQSGQSGGRSGYDEFWRSITSVAASDVEGTPPGTAVATLAYVFGDGSTSTERTSFQLVREDGVLKIASSEVLRRS